MKIDYFECSCYSPENRLVFHYDEEDNELYTEVYLFQYHNIFQRIWIAIKYIFGYKCRYGHFDCFILNPNDRGRLMRVITQLKTK